MRFPQKPWTIRAACEPEGTELWDTFEQSLGGNKVVHYRARKPFLLRAFGWCVLLLTIAVAAEIYRHGYDFLAAAAGIAGLMLFLFIMVPVWTTEIAVTNHRVIFKRGLLRRDVSDLQLRSIEQVELKQGLLGETLQHGER